MLNTFPKTADESGRDFAYRCIKKNIVDFIFLPDEKLSETSLAKELNLSRTPVREAMILLENEGMLKVHPKKGTVVSKIDVKTIESYIFIRKLAEREILTLLSSMKKKKELLKNLENQLNAQKILINIPEAKDSFFLLDDTFHELLFAACDKEKAWSEIQAISSSYKRLMKLDVLHSAFAVKRYNEHVNLIQLIKYGSPDTINDFILEHFDDMGSTLPLALTHFPEYFK